MQIRWLLVITIICGAVLGAGYRLTQTEPEVASAAGPGSIVVNKAPISSQATTVKEVETRHVQLVSAQNVTFEDQVFGYYLSHPADWTRTALSSNVVVLQASDGSARVTVEIASVLPRDGLSKFVDRSLGQDIVLTRQLLTIHNLPAERVLAFSDEIGGQVTYFYINSNNMVYVITGVGEQRLIEAVARSFKSQPQVLALR